MEINEVLIILVWNCMIIPDIGLGFLRFYMIEFLWKDSPLFNIFYGVKHAYRSTQSINPLGEL
jgi:hypothetical protein